LAHIGFKVKRSLNMTIIDFNLKFDIDVYKLLDQYALLMCQSYNLGNTTDWFGAFRGGLYAYYARLYGVTTHFKVVHAWLPYPRIPCETEYHLASIFFNMDSAIECFTFALNALGCIVAPADFRDVTHARKLRKICPYDIIGNAHLARQPVIQPLVGYSKIFPKLQEYWLQHTALIEKIKEQHDVSKHRKTIYNAGETQLDPSTGFYENMGIPNDPMIRALYRPMAEIILEKDPKQPNITRTPQTLSDQVLLEDLSMEFLEFVNETGRTTLADAKNEIILPVKSLRTS